MKTDAGDIPCKVAKEPSQLSKRTDATSKPLFRTVKRIHSVSLPLRAVGRIQTVPQPNSVPQPLRTLNRFHRHMYPPPHLCATGGQGLWHASVSSCIDKLQSLSLPRTLCQAYRLDDLRYCMRLAHHFALNAFQAAQFAPISLDG